MSNIEKIKIANELALTLKDYTELVRVSPKMKRTFNKQVIDDQHKLNENTIQELASQLK